MTTLTAGWRTVPSAVPQVAVLTGRTIRDRWRSTVGWGLGIVLTAVVQLAVYPSVARSAESMQSFVNEWPEPLREAFNLDAYSTGAGFLNAELFSMMVPFVLIALATTGAAAIAGEEERGTADLLLSLPLSRGRALMAKVLATVVAVLAVAAAAFVTILVGAPMVDLEVGTGDLAAAILMNVMLALVFGGVSLLLAASTGKRGVAIGAGVALALAAFLLNALAPMADWLEPWQDASPFHWALAGNPLVNGADWPMVLLMMVVALLFAVAAGVAYHRRDISGR